MSRHTPGKWFWSARTLQAESSEIEENDILEVDANGCIDALHTPDRNLIAAVPELLEALKAAYEKLQIECGGSREYKGGMATQFLFPLIEKAIAKAEGKA